LFFVAVGFFALVSLSLSLNFSFLPILASSILFFFFFFPPFLFLDFHSIVFQTLSPLLEIMSAKKLQRSASLNVLREIKPSSRKVLDSDTAASSLLKKTVIELQDLVVQVSPL